MVYGNRSGKEKKALKKKEQFAHVGGLDITIKGGRFLKLLWRHKDLLPASAVLRWKMKRYVESTVAPLSWLPDGIKRVNKDLLSHHVHVTFRMTPFHHLSLVFYIQYFLFEFFRNIIAKIMNILLKNNVTSNCCYLDIVLHLWVANIFIVQE